MLSQDSIKKYKKYIWDFLNDEFSPGQIDEIERGLLERHRKHFNISPELSAQIEREQIEKWNLENQTPEELVNNFPIQNFYFPMESLNRLPHFRRDLVSYSLKKNFSYLNIKTIYNEGKTGALVFEIAVNVNDKLFSRILKYDSYFKIQKEYESFTNHENIHGKLTPPRCQVITMNSNYAFLELEPANNFTKSDEVNSLRKLLTENLLFFDAESRQQLLVEPIENLFEYMFNIYKSGLYKVETEPYQNSVDQLLPARESGQLQFKNPSEVNLEDQLIEINHSSIIQYDLNLPISNKLILNYKFWDEREIIRHRLDGVFEIENPKPGVLADLEGKNLFWDSSETDFPRRVFLEKLSEKMKFLDGSYEKLGLTNVFSIVGSKRNQPIFYLDTILKKEGKNYYSKFLHGDLNPSNILFCFSRLRNHYHPIIIDFYESGVSGNLFSDIARFESEIVIIILSKLLRKYFKKRDDAKILEKEAIQYITEFENNLFNIFESKRIPESGDFLLFEMRKILMRIMKSHLEEDFNELDWYKNYILTNAVYSLRFANFKSETELSRLVSTIWSIRLFYRLENFEKTVPRERFIRQTSGIFTALTPILEMQHYCREANLEVKKELGIETISIKLFVNFYAKVFDHLRAFLEERENLFVVVGESGSGKSVFIDHYLSLDSSLYPILLVSGMNFLEKESDLLEGMKNKLGFEYSSENWIAKVHNEVKKEKRYFCIIIENLYYNFNPELAVKSLSFLLQAIKGTHIKVILTTTPSFWTEFLETNKTVRDLAYKIRSESFVRLDVPNETECEILTTNYFNEFNVLGQLINKAKTLPRIPGVLKLFCEVKQNSSIGKPEHIFMADLITKFIENKLKIIADRSKQEEKILRQILVEFSREIDSGTSLSVPSSRVKGIITKFLGAEVDPSTIQHLFIQSGILFLAKERIKFRYTEIPAYLFALYILDDWDYYKAFEEERKSFLLEKVRTMRQKPFNEIVLYYILTLVYNLPDQKFINFQETMEQILEEFDKYKYGLLRIFSRTIYSLPRIDSQILKKIHEMQRRVRGMLQKTNDRVLQREFDACFGLLDDHFVIDVDALKWTEKFEKILNDPKKIINTLASELFEWEEFTSFLRKDFSKNSNFIRNYIEPMFEKLNQRVWYKEKSIIDLSEKLLNLGQGNKNKFGWFEFHVYEILFNIIRESDEKFVSRYKPLAIKLILKRKISEKSLFERVAREFYKLTFSADKEKNYWLSFLLQFKDMNEEVDQLAFGILETEIVFINYNKIHTAVRKELDNFIYAIPRQQSIGLLKKIKFTEATDRAKFAPIFKEKESSKPIEQFLINIIIKKNNKLLLRYNRKWADFNWVGNQLNHELHNELDEKDEAIRIVKEKLKLDPTDFDLVRFTKVGSGYEKFSKSRNQTVKYIPTFFVLALKRGYKWKELTADVHHRLFDWNELLQPVNIEVSDAVKRIIMVIEQQDSLKKLWKSFPDAI